MYSGQPKLVESADVPKRAGQTLPNGAIILMEETLRQYAYRRDSIVLAINPGGVHPFVSWHRMVTTDSPLATGGYQTVDTTAHGEYSRDLNEAIDKFNDRVQKRLRSLHV